jgi:predicted transcriptional regulator
MKRETKTLGRKIKVLAAALSFLCIIALVILLTINQYRNFFGITPLLFAIYVITGLMVCFLSIFSLMEVKEYIHHFRNLKDNVYRTHRLSYEQVLDNENRKQIVESILETPGIHYTMLRKKCNLHPGQFRWHIDVLLDYEIIRKQHLENHIVFFPSISEQEFNFDVILKFPFRDEIYNLIVLNPGIFPSEIARKLNVPKQRNKVKYHIDKLIRANYVRVVRIGKKMKLYPKL